MIINFLLINIYFVSIVFLFLEICDLLSFKIEGGNKENCSCLKVIAC